MNWNNCAPPFLILLSLQTNRIFKSNISLRILLFYYSLKAYANKMYVFPTEKYTGTKFNGWGNNMMKIHFPKLPLTKLSLSRPDFSKPAFPRLSLALRQLSRQSRKLKLPSLYSPRGRLARPAALTAALFLFSFLAGELAAYGVSAWKQHNKDILGFTSTPAGAAPIQSQGKGRKAAGSQCIHRLPVAV